VSTTNVVNPGLVNVAGQSDGPVVVDQEITVTRPSTNSGPTARGITYADGEVKVDQEITVSPAMTAGRTVDGGLASPTRPGVVTTTLNNVAGQVYGSGTPHNVFV
jgi:hypothetical protein